MFVMGALAMLGGVLVAVFDGPFWLAASLLPTGVTTVDVSAIKVWQVTWQLLDIAIAVTVCTDPSHEQL